MEDEVVISFDVPFSSLTYTLDSVSTTTSSTEPTVTIRPATSTGWITISPSPTHYSNKDLVSEIEIDSLFNSFQNKNFEQILQTIKYLKNLYKHRGMENKEFFENLFSIIDEYTKEFEEFKEFLSTMDEDITNQEIKKEII